MRRTGMTSTIGRGGMIGESSRREDVGDIDEVSQQQQV